jgi:hypothetical protein
VKKRFRNKLDRRIYRNKFSYEEDQVIINIYREFGTKWEMVRELLPHRTINMIKNRYYGHIKSKYFPKNGKKG